MMTERQFLEVQIARYRFLEREVTDQLAANLLHGIVLELEADLRVSDVAKTPPGLLAPTGVWEAT